MQSQIRNLVHRFAWKASPIVVLLLAPTVLLNGQSSSSGVNGVVTDSSGAVVSGAKVTLTNVETNVERSTISSSTGDYFFSQIPPARYTLSFTATGFQKVTIEAFNIAIAQVATVNANMRVGNVEQSVTVQALDTEVESASAQLGTVI